MPKVVFENLNHDLIRKNFIDSTLLFRWREKYVIRCAINCDGAERKRTTWPFVFGMSEWQHVNAAMWDVSVGDQPLLVAAWVFSPGGDETNLLHLRAYADDVFSFHEEAKEDKTFEMPPCCDADDVFSCSSGDSPVKSFRCPALEAFQSLAALEQESPLKDEVLAWKSSRGHHVRVFYEEDPVEYSEDDEEDDEEDDDDEDQGDEEDEDDDGEDEDKEDSKAESEENSSEDNTATATKRRRMH